MSHRPSASLQATGVSGEELRHHLVPQFCSCRPDVSTSLVASVAHTHRSHGTVTDGEKVLTWLLPPGHSRDAKTEAPSLCERG